MQLSLLAPLFAASLLASPSASAQEVPDVPDVPEKAPPTLKWGLGGRVMLDYQNTLNKDEEATFKVRRARVYGDISVGDFVSVKLDWNLSKMAVHWAYVDLGGDVFTARVGKSKMPFLLGYMESSKAIPFLERPIAAGIMDVGGATQVVLKGRVGAVSYEAAFGDAENLSGSFAPVGSARVRAHAGDALVVGVASTVSQRNTFSPSFKTGSRTEFVSLDSDWSARVVRGGLESVFIQGPVRADAELYGMLVNGDRELRMAGGYISTQIMVTGERQRVSKRVEPAHPLDPKQGHLGALSVGARYEHAGTEGEANVGVDALTAGVTWYPHKYVRMPVNVGQVFAGDFRETFVSVRLQVEG